MRPQLNLQTGVFLVFTSLISTAAQAGGPAFTRLFAPAETAQTSYLNPAGMTRLEETALTGQLLLAKNYSTLKVDKDATTKDGSNPRGSDPLVVPSIYYVQPIFNEDWRLGLTLNAPGGFGAGYGPNWAGRYYSDQFSLDFIAVTATLAKRITPWLSLGGGLSVQYASSASTTQFPNLDTPNQDAKIEMDSSGVGLGFIASAQFDISEQTRFGITWHSETDPDEDTDVELKRSTLPPGIVEEINHIGDNVDASLRTPQHIDLGLYHEWDNGWSATFDAIWVDFSRFGVTDIRITGDHLPFTPDGHFKDFWVLTTGVEFPMTTAIDGRLGIFYLQKPVSDNDRSFAFSLDEMYGAGAGIVFTRENRSRIDINLNALNTGSAPVDTGPLSALSPKGRVVADNQNTWALVLEVTYHVMQF